MRRILPILVVFIICVTAFSACSSSNTTNAPTAENNVNGVDFNLADFSSPFIGEWRSEIPSANTMLKFNFKENGTFDYGELRLTPFIS